MSDLKTIELNGVEAWREYDWPERGESYRIDDPVTVSFRPGGETHRVVDAAGVCHCVPAPGTKGCVLRWMGPVVA